MVQPARSRDDLTKFTIGTVVAGVDEKRSQDAKTFYDEVVKKLISAFPAAAFGQKEKELSDALSGLSKTKYLNKSDVDEVKGRAAILLLQSAISQNLSALEQDREKHSGIVSDIEKIQQDSTYTSFSRKDALDQVYNSVRTSLEQEIQQAQEAGMETISGIQPGAEHVGAAETEKKKHEKDRKKEVEKKEAKVPVVTLSAEEKALNYLRSRIEELGFELTKPDIKNLATNVAPWLEWRKDSGSAESILESRSTTMKFENIKKNVPRDVIRLLTGWKDPKIYVAKLQDASAFVRNLKQLQDKKRLVIYKDGDIIKRLSADSITAVVREHTEIYAAEAQDAKTEDSAITAFNEAKKELSGFDKDLRERLEGVYNRAQQKLQQKGASKVKRAPKMSPRPISAPPVRISPAPAAVGAA